MLDVLYKKAKGFKFTETTKEYGVDEEGNQRLIKEKMTTKFAPPDLSAIKAYMELKDAALVNMSEEELIEEKNRLIKELKSSKKTKKESYEQKN